MSDYKTRVTSDRYEHFKEGIGSFSDDVIPVDLYGKRVFPDKAAKDNLENAGQDIKDRYCLNDDYGLKGGE